MRDLKSAEEFYVNAFGMEPLHRVCGEEHAYALEEVALAPGGAREGYKLEPAT